MGQFLKSPLSRMPTLYVKYWGPRPGQINYRQKDPNWRPLIIGPEHFFQSEAQARRAYNRAERYVARATLEYPEHTEKWISYRHRPTRQRVAAPPGVPYHIIKRAQEAVQYAAAKGFDIFTEPEDPTSPEATGDDRA